MRSVGMGTLRRRGHARIVIVVYVVAESSVLTPASWIPCAELPCGIGSGLPGRLRAAISGIMHATICDDYGADNDDHIESHDVRLRFAGRRDVRGGGLQARGRAGREGRRLGADTRDHGPEDARHGEGDAEGFPDGSRL